MKIGDKISYLGTAHCLAKMGAVARVIGFKYPYVIIRWMRWSKAHRRRCKSQSDGCYRPEHFRVVR